MPPVVCSYRRGQPVISGSVKLSEWIAGANAYPWQCEWIAGANAYPWQCEWIASANPNSSYTRQCAAIGMDSSACGAIGMDSKS